MVIIRYTMLVLTFLSFPNVAISGLCSHLSTEWKKKIGIKIATKFHLMVNKTAWSTKRVPGQQGYTVRS